MLPNNALLSFKIQDLYLFKDPKLILLTDKCLDKDYTELWARNPTYENAYCDLFSQFPKLPQTSRTFGMGFEIEVESAPQLVFPGWKTIEEGSLRNNGKEYVSSPIEHFAAPIALSALYTLLLLWRGVKGEKIDFSWRTSIHVHLNVRDFTIEEVLKLLLLHTVFEKVLFRFSGNKRDQSIFCVPFRHSILLKSLSRFCAGEYSIGHLQSTWDKYSAINLSRLHDYGTIEFRHLAGTENIKKIGTWTGFILCLAEAATTLSLDEIIKVILSLNTTSKFDLFVTTVFKPPFNKLLTAESTKDFEEGITACKEILETPKEISVSAGSIMGKIIEKKTEESKRKEEERRKKSKVAQPKAGLQKNLGDFLIQPVKMNYNLDPGFVYYVDEENH